LYADEPGHLEIRALEGVVISALARVEVPAALWRKARLGQLEETDAAVLVSEFEVDFHGESGTAPRFTVAAVNEQVLVAAARESARHSLRAYDAVQLASALAVQAVDPRCSAFACFDAALRKATARAGLELVP